MIFKINILLLTILFTACNKKSPGSVRINISDVDLESEYIWRTIQDISFFEEHGYQISLPKGELIELLKIKAKSNNLTEKDYTDLKNYIRDSVYNKSDYLRGYDKIENELSLIHKMISEISHADRNWDFKKFDTYQVNLTLYGPGGSYNADEGSILIYTTPNGDFKQYDNPANIVIHEVTHIGIEAAIVNKFQIPHPLKERIVDTFVSLHFSEYLPDYKIQDMGDERIDPYLKNKSDLRNLNEFVKQIMRID